MKKAIFVLTRTVTSKRSTENDAPLLRLICRNYAAVYVAKALCVSYVKVKETMRACDATAL